MQLCDRHGHSELVPVVCTASKQESECAIQEHDVDICQARAKEALQREPGAGRDVEKTPRTGVT